MSEKAISAGRNMYYEGRHGAEEPEDTDARLALMQELQAQRAELAEWNKLRDPVTLHVSLLRGFPAKLNRDTFLHIAGDPVYPQNATEPMQKAMLRAFLLRKSMNDVWRAALAELGA